LNKTYLFYGKERREKEANQKTQDLNAATAGAPIAAARAVSKGSGVYRQADADLVDKLKADPKFDIKKVPVEELSEELKKMTPEDREKHVKACLAKRETVQKEISELNKQRETYIQSERKKNPSAADKAFDEAVRGAIREQAKKKGIEIPEQ